MLNIATRLLNVNIHVNGHHIMLAATEKN